MSNMKCPFCQQELDSDSQSWELGCSNPDCETAGTMCGTKELWQELIRTRKALDVAKDTLHWYDDNYDSVVARNTLDEITALIKGGDNE